MCKEEGFRYKDDNKNNKIIRSFQVFREILLKVVEILYGLEF